MTDTISGFTHLNGSPVQARVSLIDVASNSIVGTTLSDAGTGAWAFSGLPAGQYEVVQMVEGYKARVDGPWVLSDAGGFPPGAWSLPGIAHTWWVRPMVAQYGDALYVGGISREGVIKVFRVSSDAVSSFDLHSGARGDDHNAPSITRLPDGRLLAMYTRHGLESQLRFRISTSADDISGWGAEQSLGTSGPATYSQVWVDQTGRVHLFYRVTTLTWAHRFSDDNGQTWSAEKVFLGTSNRPYIATTPLDADSNKLRIAVAGHPIDSSDHNIYFGEIDLISGDITSEGVATVNLYDTSPLIGPDALEKAFSAEGSNSRMFDIGGGVQPRILFATFTGPSDAVYREARKEAGAWVVSAPIASAGAPIENPVGANFYFAGMAASRDANKVLLARRDDSSANWLLEEYQRLGTASWTLSRTLHEEDWRTFNELYRPFVPFNASASLPVTVLRGEYSGYGTSSDHSDHRTDVVFNFEDVPGFEAEVLYEQSFADLPDGTQVPGWEILTKSSGVSDESFSVQSEGDYFGGRYGVFFHRDSLAALWGVSGGVALNVAVKADVRMEQGVPGTIGLIARWKDASNRIEMDADFYRDTLNIKERVAGVTHTTTESLGGLDISEATTLEMRVEGQMVTGRALRNGVVMAEVTAPLVASSEAGMFGIKASSQTSASVTEVQTQRVLITRLD